MSSNEEKEDIIFEGFVTPASAIAPNSDSKTNDDIQTIDQNLDRLQFKNQVHQMSSSGIDDLEAIATPTMEGEKNVRSVDENPDSTITESGQATPFAQAVQVAESQLRDERVDDLEKQLQRKDEHTKKLVRWVGIGLLLLVVAIGGIVWGVCGSGKYCRAPSSPRTSPTAAPSADFVLDLERARAISEAIDSLSVMQLDYFSNETNNPSWEEIALQWLVENDRTAFVLNEGDLERLSQRFVLASLMLRVGQVNGELHECDWLGVRCRNNFTVDGVVFDNKRLPGTIPVDIGVLSSLDTLDLVQNSLVGSLPSSLYTISTLQVLRLSTNKLTGDPLQPKVSRMTNLVEISLDNNEFLGGIRQGLSSLTNLIGLNLSRNRFVGNLPTDLGLTTSLLFLLLSENSFTGIVPTDLGQLTGMRALLLDGEHRLSQSISSFLTISPSSIPQGML